MDSDEPIVRGGQGRSDSSILDEGWMITYFACLVVLAVCASCFYQWLFLGRV